MLMEKPIAVANYFIDKAIRANAELTPTKLVKLVYIAHGHWIEPMTPSSFLN